MHTLFAYVDGFDLQYVADELEESCESFVSDQHWEWLCSMGCEPAAPGSRQALLSSLQRSWRGTRPLNRSPSAGCRPSDANPHTRPHKGHVVASALAEQ